MKSRDIFLKDSRFIAHTYQRFPVAVRDGHGAQATDFHGKKYIDFGSGIGTNVLGFCPEKWMDAVKEQLTKVQHTSNLFYTLPAAQLAEHLCKATGYQKVFFGNSGAEANEGAIKIARKYGMEQKGEHCNRIITMENSFHGRTITTLSATGQESFHQYFFPFTDGFISIPIHDIQRLKNSIDDSICAVMLELVQGEGGVVALEKGHVKEIEQLCNKHNILLIVDEVQTGIGRTGTFLCCEQYDIHPNLVTLAKGLGAGLPIGAILMDEITQEVLQPGQHGSTFGGNPVICAGASEVVKQVCNPAFLADVVAKAAYLRREMVALPGVSEVSGLGMMLGISVTQENNARKIAETCVENGLLILTAKKKLRVMPPLNITKDEINQGVQILAHSLQAILSEK